MVLVNEQYTNGRERSSMDEIPVSAAQVRLSSLAIKVWIAIKDPWICSVALVLRCISSRLSLKNCGVNPKTKCNSVWIGFYVKVWNNFGWVRNNFGTRSKTLDLKPVNCGWIADEFWTNFYNLLRLRLRDCHSGNVRFTGFSARARFRVSWPIMILGTLENVSHLFVFYFFYFEYFS